MIDIITSAIQCESVLIQEFQVEVSTATTGTHRVQLFVIQVSVVVVLGAERIEIVGFKHARPRNARCRLHHLRGQI